MLPSFFLFPHSKNPATYDRIFAVVKHPCSYYDFTTFHVLNLPRFAAFCLFCDKFNNLRAKIIVGKLRQNGANRGSGNGVYTVFTTIRLHLILWHGTVGGKLRQNVAFKG